MNIKEVKAAGIIQPATFGKTGGPKRTLAETADAGNPLSRYIDHQSQGHRFQPPWSDVVCVVTAEDGTWGMGMSRHSGPVVPIINDYFAPLLTGGDVMATERHYDLMLRIASAHMGVSGIASYAISAVDLALWDLKGKLLGRPVYTLLGGPAREKIYCYATGHDFDWFEELGFKAIKIWNLHGANRGIAALERNEAMVAATRERLGAGFEIMLDMWLVHDITFTVELPSGCVLTGSSGWRITSCPTTPKATRKCAGVCPGKLWRVESAGTRTYRFNARPRTEYWTSFNRMCSG